MSKLTVVIKYESGQPEPRFHAGMQALGGEVVAVQFSDSLMENELLREYCRQVDISAAENDDRWPTPNGELTGERRRSESSE